VIRVGFVLTSEGWLGGVNYFRNLFSAISLLKERKVQVVLFVGRKVQSQVLSQFCNAEIVRSAWLDATTPMGFLRRVLNRLTGYKDPLLRLLLRRNGIDVVSHYSAQWSGGNIRKIGWIPDFQHVYLPHFFSTTEIAQRNAHFRGLIRSCDLVLLSSVSAQKDLAGFCPDAIGKSAVLRFVPEIDAGMALVDLDTLEGRYNFRGPYFYIPNQFWAHKNHGLVVDALKILKADGVEVTVVLSGNTRDYRSPDYYSRLMSRVHAAGVESLFKVLGVIPYGDLISLMGHSVALINPSLFEGWSSTVEEGKALGKTILLSNLPVHLEQQPSRGIYFDPANAYELAEKMRDTLSEWRTAPAPHCDKLTLDGSYCARRLAFATEYQAMVERVMNLCQK
jgi:glycosyltransferase involved in cell wall biosynthesis